MLKSGNTLVVKSLGQLSRNKSDIKNELQYFRDHHLPPSTTRKQVQECGHQLGSAKSFVDPSSKYYQRKCYGYTHKENARLSGWLSSRGIGGLKVGIQKHEHYLSANRFVSRSSARGKYFSSSQCIFSNSKLSVSCSASKIK